MRVRNTAGMSPEDFVQHMNLRHAQDGELADLRWLSEHAAQKEHDRRTWEAYHARLHATRQYNHEHGGAE